MGGYFSQVQDAAADAEAIVVNASTGATVARGEAQSLSGTGNAAAKDLGIAQSAGTGAVQNTGALALGGQSNNFSGATITAGYDAGAFRNALQDVGNNLNSAVQAQSARSAETLNSVLGRVSELAESKQTDGISGLSKTALWLAGLVAAAVVVAAIYFSKK